jgi:hypothetical protein
MVNDKIDLQSLSDYAFDTPAALYFPNIVDEVTLGVLPATIFGFEDFTDYVYKLKYKYKEMVVFFDMDKTPQLFTPYTGEINKLRVTDAFTFIASSIFKFGFPAFEYNLVEYRGVNNPVTITCSHCSNTFSITPYKHLRAKVGCKQCKPKYNTFEECVKKLMESEL